MAKDLITKYVWLVETIYRAGKITLEEINQKWLDQGMEEKPIARRTFHKWKEATEMLFDLNIECERKGGYHYYIGNEEDIKRDNIRNWLLKTFSVSNLLLNSQSIKDRILLEEIPSGQEHLPAIIDAMKTNTQLKITYQSYWKKESNTFNINPYCLKLFKQRWYLVAYNPYYNRVIIYATDRILKLWRVDEERFQIPKEFDAEAFFFNSYGIIVGTGKKVETVKLKVSAPQANYLRSLPLHETQKEVETNEEYSIFTLLICPEFDFQQELLSKGNEIEVLEPKWLRAEMAEKIEQMWNKYKQE
ncbi:MAG: WYL domain-containing protein [Paludibacteraceae bacterium]|nr:WYL domain-containing protein [Paludibacteraceae bacterium]MBR4839723.1 WYL domain-containing protein [Paludibacteraceae bacterium]